MESLPLLARNKVFAELDANRDEEQQVKARAATPTKTLDRPHSLSAHLAQWGSAIGSRATDAMGRLTSSRGTGAAGPGVDANLAVEARLQAALRDARGAGVSAARVELIVVAAWGSQLAPQTKAAGAEQSDSAGIGYLATLGRLRARVQELEQQTATAEKRGRFTSRLISDFSGQMTDSTGRLTVTPERISALETSADHDDGPLLPFGEDASIAELRAFIFATMSRVEAARVSQTAQRYQEQSSSSDTAGVREGGKTFVSVHVLPCFV